MKQIKYFYKGLLIVLKKYLTDQQIHEYLFPYASLNSQLVSDTVESEILFEIVFKERPVDKESRLVVDTLVTYLNRILTKEKCGKLLLELGMVMLTQGELNLAFELATFAHKSIEDD